MSETATENETKKTSTRRELSLSGRKFTLIGTAHVSAESIVEVQDTIKEIKPDCVSIELDEKRADSIQNPDKYRNLDIVKVLRRHEGFLMLANLVLSSFQRRMGQNIGVKPGDEMLAAMKTAQELNIPTTMVDRPIQITLRRAWKRNRLWGKCKLLASLLSSAFSKEKISEEEIENLKTGSEMDSMMNELSDYMPIVKEVLIDERDRYLASKIWTSQGNNIVAVLGAGHLNGVVAYLEKISAGEATADVSDIESIPPKGVAGKIIPWIIPTAILGLFIAGFIYGGIAESKAITEELAKVDQTELAAAAEGLSGFQLWWHNLNAGLKMAITWVLWNGIPAAIGTALAAGNPITILLAFVSAPFTSMCPFVGVGFVTGIIQALICKPRISDMETLQADVSSFKGWYKNRILRVLLVFILSSLGSVLGTFAGGGNMIKILTEIE